MLNYKNPLFIINMNTKGGKIKKDIENHEKIIQQQKLFPKFDTYLSTNALKAKDKIKNSVKNKTNDLFVCIGGDGSISLIANVLMESSIKDRIPIWSIPAGSGNSLLKDFSYFTIFDAIERIKKNKITFLDILKVEELGNENQSVPSKVYYCINVLGMGFISDVAQFGTDLNKCFGDFTYTLGIFFKIAQFRPYNTEIIINNGEYTFQSNRIYFLTLSNSKYSGGNIMIAPTANTDDGQMVLNAYYDINRKQFLSGFFKALKGKHIHDKGVLYRKVTQVEIHSEPHFKLMPDGDLFGTTPIRVTVMPKQIPMII